MAVSGFNVKVLGNVVHHHKSFVGGGIGTNSTICTCHWKLAFRYIILHAQNLNHVLNLSHINVIKML